MELERLKLAWHGLSLVDESVVMTEDGPYRVLVFALRNNIGLQQQSFILPGYVSFK